MKLQRADKLERKRYDRLSQQKDDIYRYRLYIGLEPKPTSDEKTLKIRRLF